MGGCITLINSSMYFLISVLQDILVIDVRKSMPNTVILFRIFSEDIDAILEISDLGVVVDAFSLEISDFSLEVSDLGIVVDAFSLEISDFSLEASDLGVVVDAFGLETSNLGIFFRHPTPQPLYYLLHFKSLLQEVPACLIPIGGYLSSLSLSGVFRSFPQFTFGSINIV